MIARLEGVLVDRVGTHIVIDCNGVGYEVVCSAYTLAALPALDERVKLRIFTQAQENKISLFGFIDAAERSLFDLLITVKNVGPSTAIAILSGGAAPRDIAQLIARNDLNGLNRIKGVGKKTAELLVVELREKCELLLLSWNAEGGVRPAAISAGSTRSSHPLRAEVIAALVGMGWRAAEAEQAVADLPLAPGDTLEGLLRQALRSMPR
jgi:holliday junction DNA helicase RuvA